MASVPDPMPIPAELALDQEPFHQAVLDQWAAYVAADAEDAALDAGALARDVLDTVRDGDGDELGRWQITDDGAAEWAMRHVVALNVERSQLAAQADEWVRRIRLWFDQAARPIDAKIGFFTSHLERYALRRRAEDPKVKTIALPSGRVATRASSPTVAVYDEEQLLAWCKENLEPDEAATVIRTTEKVLVAELRHHVVLVEVPTSVVVSPCGCITRPIHPPDPATGMESPVEWQTAGELAAWTVGTEVRCPGCGDFGLVAQWADTEHVVRDGAGRPVPGADVRPGETKATVTAERP